MNYDGGCAKIAKGIIQNIIPLNIKGNGVGSSWQQSGGGFCQQNEAWHVKETKYGKDQFGKYTLILFSDIEAQQLLCFSKIIYCQQNVGR